MHLWWESPGKGFLSTDILESEGPSGPHHASPLQGRSLGGSGGGCGSLAVICVVAQPALSAATAAAAVGNDGAQPPAATAASHGSRPPAASTTGVTAPAPAPRSISCQRPPAATAAAAASAASTAPASPEDPASRVPRHAATGDDKPAATTAADGGATPAVPEPAEPHRQSTQPHHGPDSRRQPQEGRCGRCGGSGKRRINKHATSPDATAAAPVCPAARPATAAHEPTAPTSAVIPAAAGSGGSSHGLQSLAAPVHPGTASACHVQRFGPTAASATGSSASTAVRAPAAAPVCAPTASAAAAPICDGPSLRGAEPPSHVPLEWHDQHAAAEALNGHAAATNHRTAAPIDASGSHDAAADVYRAAVFLLQPVNTARKLYRPKCPSIHHAAAYAKGSVGFPAPCCECALKELYHSTVHLAHWCLSDGSAYGTF